VCWPNVSQGKEDLELERRKSEIDKWNKSLVVEDPTFYTHWKTGAGQLAAGEPLLDGPPLKQSLKANPVERCPWSMMASEQCVVAPAAVTRCDCTAAVAAAVVSLWLRCSCC
jgi:hypothetical protein